MIVGVMSDTHGNIEYMQRACDIIIDKFGAEAIVHLGDDYDDAQRMDRRGRPLYAVPGMYERAWCDDKIPHRLIKQFGGVVFLLSHTPTRDRHDKAGDINPARALSMYGAEVLMHGHTHKYRVMESVEGLIVICPGHVRSDLDRGSPPSFAIVESERPNVKVRFVSLDGDVLEERDLRIAKADEYEEMEPTEVENSSEESSE
jgi:putative phosphoesterase